MVKKSVGLLVLLLLLIGEVNSQLGFTFYDGIPVSVGGKSLRLPWSGGLNHPQFSKIDVDFDGIEDLFVFDRGAHRVRVFLSKADENGQPYYEYLHLGERRFPSDLRHRVALIDYDGDGRKDIFTYGIGGIKVYRNIGTNDTGLNWELAKTIILSDYVGFKQPLFVSSIDIPAYIDVDQDGDIDVLTFNIGGQRMEFHQNLSMELYGHADSLVFQLTNPCWGKFTEAELNNTITLNADEGPCGDQQFLLDSLTEVERENRHAGSTVLALDLNNDQALDLLLGDVESSAITALFGDGTDSNQWPKMTAVNTNFPSNTTPVNLEIMPASFFLDVDFDGVNDLIFASNVNGGSENRGGILLYKNIGSNLQPNFILNNANFLHDDMIDNGRGAIPILADVNGDGLTDLLVSSTYRYASFLEKSSGIQYFQNTGSENSPEFTFITDDWLGLSQRGLGLRLFPAFNDINGDGKVDLVIGTETGRLFYILRTGNNANQFENQIFPLLDHIGNQIQVNGFASPHFSDVNGDNNPDLLIGQRTGGLVYFENVSDNQLPSFELKNSDLGSLALGAPESYGVPSLIEVNDTLHLLVGTRSGNVHFYENIRDSWSDSIWVPSSTNFSFIQTGAFSSITVGKLKNDGSLSLIVGGELGGLWSYQAAAGSLPILSANQIPPKVRQAKVFPNPIGSDIQQLTVQSETPIQRMELFTSFGNRLVEVHDSNTLPLANLSSGTYFLKLIFLNGQQEVHKVIRQ